MNIEISDSTFKRLQKHAKPLVDTSDSIIVRLLDSFERSQQRPAAPPPKTDSLTDTERDLWELVIRHLPDRFSLHDVHSHQQPFVERRPHVREIEAAIRATMQRLRDKGYVEFTDNQGMYRRLH